MYDHFESFLETYNRVYVSKFGSFRIYKQMHKMLIDDCVVIAGYSRTKLWIWHNNVIAYPGEDVHGNYLKYVDVK